MHPLPTNSRHRTLRIADREATATSFGPWTMMNQDQYEVMLLAARGVNASDLLPENLVHPGGDDGLIDTWGELAHESATATWEFCDHNDDGLACVMKQTAPSGAGGWVMAFITLDNHPFPS